LNTSIDPKKKCCMIGNLARTSPSYLDTERQTQRQRDTETETQRQRDRDRDRERERYMVRSCL